MKAEEKIRSLIEDCVTNILATIQRRVGQQSFSEIVEMTTNTVHQLGTALLEEIITVFDEQYNLERDRHKIIMRNHKSRRMLTQMGEITLKRRLYFDKEKQRYFFPVDEMLDIEKYSRIDTGLKKELLSNATLTSYGKASELSGNKVSRQTVHNIIKKLPQEQAKVKPQGYKSVEKIYIEADEDHIHLNTGVSAEVKLVYVHEGTREICKGRKELINAKYFTSVSKKENEIWSEVYNYVCSQYKMSTAEIHISGDGAQWIKAGLDYFHRAKYHLDKFHVYKSITDVSGADRAMRTAVIEALKMKDFNTIQNLYSIRNQKAVKVRERKYVASGLFYLENNFDEIDLSKTYSCAAEGHVSHVLSARLSSRPMGWSLFGADKMAKLRAYYFSGGDFSRLVGGRKLQEVMQNSEATFNYRYKRIAAKGVTTYNASTARVVGLDGITNGLSVILRSIMRRK